MKKVLLLAAAALVMTSASAQLKVSAQHKAARPETHAIPAPKMEVAQMRTPGAPVVKAPKKVEYHDAYYNRPAGMFPGSLFMEPDGSSGGIAFAPYMATKPYVPYTFEAIYDDETPETVYEWDFQYYAGNGVYAWETLTGKKVEYTYGYELDSVPCLWVLDGDKMLDYFLQGNYQGKKYSSHIMAAPSAADMFSDVEEGGAVLVSSKNFCWGGFQNDKDAPFTYYSGIDPYGDNENGWWFGKNGGTSTNTTTGVVRTLRIDGIGQAYEKPSHPYLLKRVVVDAAIVNVTDQVDMTCRIYKLDSIPAYIEDGEAALPEEPGELIATGRATLTPEMYPDPEDGGFIIFNIYDEEDGLEVEYTPTIDCAILVVVDGYNDEGMENLKDFSALVSSDMAHDEGFGELAYLKYGLNDDEGNFTGDYVWAGLNNFFTSGSMMTGFTILLDIENPFLTFSYNLEDGEFTFPKEGGLMEKVLYDDGQDQLVTRSIDFFSWVPSVDEGWTLTCNGDDVPEWLSIELTDGEEDGEFNNRVLAEVVAEPLPEGVAYREAVVRFEFPGAYLDYKFMQGEKPIYNIFDINRDNEVNIGDVNVLIDMILNSDQNTVGDCNQDGEVNIADVNALIDYILNM